MTDHVRKQIRDAVALALTGLPTTEDRVYVGRTRALAANHEPTLLVYTTQEESRRAVMGRPPKLERTVSVMVEVRVSAATPPDDLLDQIAAEVEAALWETSALDSLMHNIQLVGMQVAVEAPGQSHLGGLRMEYRVTYRTDEGSPHVTG